MSGRFVKTIESMSGRFVKTIESIVVSRSGYLLLSSVPIVLAAAMIWMKMGWLGVIQNLDNLGVLAAAIQSFLASARQWYKRTRPGGGS